MRNRPTAFLAIAAASALLLSACGGDDSSDDPPVASVDASAFPKGSTMARLAEAGTMTVGTKFDQPLFGLVGPDGNPVGFDVEIAKIIAGELGIVPGDIEWVETVSANRETFIQEDRVNIVVATYTINDDRKKVIDFAGPYYLAGQSLMVRADDDSVTSEADLSGKIVCSAEGSTPAKNIEENFPDAELRTFSQYTDCLDPLRNGQVDVLTTDNVILAGYVDESPDDFKLAGEQFTEEPYGIGLKKDDTEFRSFVNDTLEAAHEDGRWDAAWEATAGAVLTTPTPPAVDRY